MKKTKQLLSFLLALVMILGTLTAFPIAASAEPWDGETKAKPAGSGTKEDPFRVATAENLAWISYMTANRNEANREFNTGFATYDVFKGMYFVQTADIDLGGKTFTPIGTTQAASKANRISFAGSYDGRSYKISNAIITPSKSVSTLTYATFMEKGYQAGGLFGVLDENATISNINACNIKVGTLDTSKKSYATAYTTLVAGVIAGTCNGAAKIINCTTDADCAAYGAYAAGGIMGASEGGVEISECVNNATVSGDKATGGILGIAYNATVSYCVNNGTVQHFTTNRWSGVGGIIGSPAGSAENLSVFVKYCINSATAKVGSTSLQAADSGSNRVAIGGIMGNDAANASCNIVYKYCYNLQEHFTSNFVNNGNSSADLLTACAGIAGYSKDNTGSGARTFENCFSVACDYTNDRYGTKEMIDCDYNPQRESYNPSPYSGLLCAALNDTQITWALGDPIEPFATCKYRLTDNDLAQDAEYQSILDVVAVNAAYAKAPRYVGVQETLAKDESYALRFIMTAASTEYYEMGIEVIATYGDDQTATYTLKADKYYDGLTGTKNGAVVEYTAEQFGGAKLMALTQKIDLATMGAVAYTVTPYFVETAGGETAYGRSWTVLYTAEGSFVSQRIVEVVEEDMTSQFTFVYPLTSANAAVYPIVTLQNYIYTLKGILLKRKSSSSTKKDAYEIVSKEVVGMETGSFELRVENNRLYILASDPFGFVAAASHLTSKTFPTGSIVLNDSCNATGKYNREMLAEKSGSNRVMLHNAWGRDGTNTYFNSVTAYQYELALVMAYSPDVVGLNEFWNGWKSSGFTAAMEQNGYVYVKPEDDQGKDPGLGNVLYYNAETTEYIEGSCKYMSYGKVYKTTDDDGDGIGQLQKWPDGSSAGRYYDPNQFDPAKSAIVATFKNKQTGEIYSVCCTHLESNGPVDPQVAPMGNPVRWEQMEQLIPFLKDYQAEFGAPLMMGGDLNSADSYKAGTYSAAGGSYTVDENTKVTHHTGEEICVLKSVCDMMIAAGFTNARNNTTDTALNNSCNGYPIWSNALMAYVSYVGLVTGVDTTGYAGSIDHIYVLDGETDKEIEELVYRNIAMELSLMTSDHKPVMLDFNVKDAQ